MRILVVSNLYPPAVQGGYEILCAQVVEWLRARGHEVVVLTTGEEEGQLRLSAPFPGPPRRYRLFMLKLERHNRRATRDCIKRVGPEVVFLWSQLRLGSGPARAAEASGVPVVYTWNDDHILGLAPVAWQLSPRRLLGALSDYSWARAATWKGLKFGRALTISRKLRDLLQQGGYAGPLKVVYQGVPLEKFPPRPTSQESEVPTRLLYVGQLHEYKGVHTLLEALAHCPEWQLTIVGSGNPEYTRRLEAMAQPLGERVAFRGRLGHDQLSEVYRQHDAFVFPSIWDEPYGLTHLEAMASGLAVVATLHGGHGEHLQDRVNCLGFAKGSWAQLAQALDALQKEAGLARRLAEQGRRLVEEQLNFERYAREVEDYLWCALTP